MQAFGHDELSDCRHIVLSLTHTHPLSRSVFVYVCVCVYVCQVTPFLLESIRNKTGGKSLAANIQLVKNNAAVGSQIAVALSALG